MLTLVLDEYSDARTLLERAVERWRDLGNLNGEADALQWLGASIFFPGDYAGARGVLARGAELCRELDDRGGLAHTLTWLGWVALSELRLGKALAVLDAAVAAGRTASDRSALGFALDFLGYALLATGDAAAAGAAFAEARTVLEDVGNYHMLGYAMAGLGAAALATGHGAAADDMLTAGLRLLHAVPDAIGVPLVLELLACSAVVRQRARASAWSGSRRRGAARFARQSRDVGLRWSARSSYRSGAGCHGRRPCGTRLDAWPSAVPGRGSRHCVARGRHVRFHFPTPACLENA